MPNSYTININQNVRFQSGKYMSDQIQNGRPSVTINFNMPDILKTMPDS